MQSSELSIEIRLFATMSILV